jgi:hypothetical protein
MSFIFTLENLIDFLELQDKNLVVIHGFGNPHSDRGCYENVAFDPKDNVTIGEMIEYAKSAIGKTFEGYKGGQFKMSPLTKVSIGFKDEAGTPLTYTMLYNWLSLSQDSKQRSI